ncbi:MULTISPECIES: DedA family protein [unclassified Nocardioides]|uniref:DedA family protein n=1 Tax=unclassified Nocardioides TaxID=2615069 RepID=UPI0005A0E073|nr:MULTISPECIES: DedA family protein [unclassified Nocardioides]
MTGLIEHLLATPAWVALLVVFALPALESSAFLGFVFPGELAVLLGGVVASQGHVPLGGVLAAGVGGAIAGDAVGYLVGRRWGRRILDSTLGRFVKVEHLDRAEVALARRGGWAVFLGRFTVALRVMIPGLAGMAGMPYRRFALANVTGGALWGATVALAGYLAGSSWHVVEHDMSVAGIGVTLGVIALLLIAHAIGRRRARTRTATSNPESIGGSDGSGRRRNGDAGLGGHGTRGGAASADSPLV